MRNIVLFDLDGTLADITHRRHHVEKADKKDADWRAFYAAGVDDLVNLPVAAMFDVLRQSGRQVWIVSGRSDEVKAETLAWLSNACLVPDRLLMREANNHEPDVKLKRRWILDGTIPADQVLCVFDDRASVVDMWREEGLACFQVARGDF